MRTVAEVRSQLKIANRALEAQSSLYNQAPSNVRMACLQRAGAHVRELEAALENAKARGAVADSDLA